jgi:hypothetical protein
MIGLRNIDYILSLLVLISLSVILTLQYWTASNNTNITFSNVKKIDKIVNGNRVNQPNIISSEDKHFITDPINLPKKNYNKLYNLTSEIYSFFTYSEADSSGNYEIFNDFSEGRKFNLNYSFDKDTDLRITYNAKLQRIEFVVDNILNKYSKEYKAIYQLDDINSDSIVKIGNIIIDLENYENDKYISVKDIENVVEVKRIIKKDNNILSANNFSFEAGPWQEEVTNCSEKSVDGRPKINMSISNDSSEGEKSISLESDNHFACTLKRFDIKSQDKNYYKLSFDYKNLEGNLLMYEYELNSFIDDERVVEDHFFEFLEPDNSVWNNHSVFIEPGDEEGNYKKFNEFVIRIHSPSRGEKRIVNLYDNFTLSRYEEDNNSSIEIKRVFEESNNDAEYRISSELIDYSAIKELDFFKENDNLLKEYNFSFEQGNWNKEVGNCNRNFPGAPNIYTELNSKDSTEGKRSLEIGSKNHFACVSNFVPIELDSNKQYKFSFDYKNIKGKSAYYYIIFVSEDRLPTEESTGFSVLLDNSDVSLSGRYIGVVESGKWYKHEEIIRPEVNNVRALIIHFLAPSNGSKEFINLYDNVRLEEFAPKDIDNYYLYSEQEVDESPKVDSLEYTNLDRYTHKVRLNGLEDSTLVYFPEGYSDSWKAFPIQTDEPPEEQNVSDFTVPQEESNRQADSQEVRAYFDQGKVSTVGDKYIGKNFDDSIRNDNLKPGGTLSVLGKQAIDGSRHYKLNDYGNAWYIDVEEYCKNRNVCVDNGDGTFDLELIIRHENKFYLQLIQISGMFALILPLGWVIGRGLRQPFKHRQANQEKPKRLEQPKTTEEIKEPSKAIEKEKTEESTKVKKSKESSLESKPQKRSWVEEFYAEKTNSSRDGQRGDKTQKVSQNQDPNDLQKEGGRDSLDVEFTQKEGKNETKSAAETWKKRVLIKTDTAKDDSA